VFGQLKLGALHVRTPTLQLDIRDLTIDWRPAALASRGSTSPACPPPKSRWPAPERRADDAAGQPRIAAAARIDRFRIDRLRSASSSTASPRARLELTALRQPRSDGRQHRLTELKAAAPFGQLAANLDLDGRRPFPLKARPASPPARPAKPTR
jgi:hypothetical protein